ncbi:MAG: membrane protein insertion efficiency factor YidD [Candidatus Brocadia sp.]|nr:membrane protein insertion efficiency factor YidD [Candidatus Brocadia sp.]MDG6025501.1 membrane protein insertion efficiency factor YidD [Candidatus Brocadia sp.]
MNRIIIKVVQAYQLLISPLLGPSCRYEPTCSQYMIEAVRKKGVLWGLCLGVWRVLRCHPLGSSGYDPVK